jgi:hypothetical protein
MLQATKSPWQRAKYFPVSFGRSASYQLSSVDYSVISPCQILNTTALHHCIAPATPINSQGDGFYYEAFHIPQQNTVYSMFATFHIINYIRASIKFLSLTVI